MVLTAYDTPMAEFVDQAGVDEVLVGDSLGMAVLGYSSTRFVTMDEMMHHVKAVRRGVKRALLVADMPYRSYRTPAIAYRNATRFVKEGGCEAVKLEGGREILPVIRFLRKKRIPVQGHLGLLPQSVLPGRPFRLQAKDLHSARRLIEDASFLEKEGAFSVVLESIPREVARIVTKRLRIPTIGIGAGPDCDGQVLVVNDLLGLFTKFKPRFVKSYALLAPKIERAVRNYRQDVLKGRFPSRRHAFQMNPETLRHLRRLLDND